MTAATTTRPSSMSLRIGGFLVALLLSRTLVTIIVSFVPHWFPIQACLDNNANTTCLGSDEDDNDEDIYISLMYITSQTTTLLVSPLIGILVDSVGFDGPILVGIMFLLFTTLIFAFAKDVYIFIIARIFHGIGASFIFIAGTGLISCSQYSEGVINHLYTLEWLIYGFDVFGPVYGGVVDSLFGQKVTFFILASILIGNLFLYIVGIMISDNSHETPQSESDGTTKNHSTYEQCGFKSLLTNSYIVAASVLVGIAIIPKAFLDPVIPVWMDQEFDSDSWTIAMVYIPQWICFEAAILFCALVLDKKTQIWRLVFINLISISFSSMCLNLVKTNWEVAIPTSCLSFSSTVVRFLLFSVMAYLSRHIFPLDVGRIFALFDFFTILPFAIGPLISLPIYHYAGVLWLSITISMSSLLFSPLAFRFRSVFDVTTPGEKEHLAITPSPEPIYTTTPVHQQSILKNKSS